MSERVFKFLLSELKLVRIKCKHAKCGAVVERPLRDLATAGMQSCPVCDGILFVPPDNAPNFTLKNLADVVGFLSGDQHKAEIEFVLPEEN